MKRVLNLLGIGIFAVLLFTACSKDDNPADNNLFVGTYSGETSYTSTGTSVSAGSGKVTVVKVGDKYRFDFKDNGDIPTITDIEISKGDEGYVGKVNGYTGVITIDAGHLSIHVTKDNAAWNAEADR
ncbi:hypothetical protein GCM10027051_05640 [Niabella terrae]